MKVFVTGGTGLIGSRLIRALRKRGDEVMALSRQADAWERVGQDVTVIQGDPTQPGDWQDALAACDGVVNLAGAGVFDKRWNAAYKQTMRDSRVNGTANVVAALAKPGAACKVLVNGSAIGYYGPHGDEELTEDSPNGNDFMAKLCAEWEATARNAEASGVRVAMIRTGVVLDRRGGALKQLLLPFQIGAGGPVGSGRQYLSWIHHADIVGIMLLALDHAEARGPINGTAPQPVTNKAFGKALGAALGRPAFMPTPGFGLRLVLGEVAQMVTTGQRVIPAKAKALGYQFQYPEIGAAFRSILKPTAV
ncbi:MAG: TIGR01777 family oxidoreductase [Gemmataceae bacterium]